MSPSADTTGRAMPTMDASTPAPHYQKEAKGRLGLRSRLSEDGMELLMIEVADDGTGAE